MFGSTYVIPLLEGSCLCFSTFLAIFLGSFIAFARYTPHYSCGKFKLLISLNIYIYSKNCKSWDIISSHRFHLLIELTFLNSFSKQLSPCTYFSSIFLVLYFPSSMIIFFFSSDEIPCSLRNNDELLVI